MLLPVFADTNNSHDFIQNYQPKKKKSRRWPKKILHKIKKQQEILKFRELRAQRLNDKLEQQKILIDVTGANIKHVQTTISNMKRKPTKGHKKKLSKAVNDFKLSVQDFRLHQRILKVSL